MRKSQITLVLIVLVLTLVVCGCGQDSSKPDVESIQDNIVYFRDGRTGLCFASVNSDTYYGWEVTSITCVPCDSLRYLTILSTSYEGAQNIQTIFEANRRREFNPTHGMVPKGALVKRESVKRNE